MPASSLLPRFSRFRFGERYGAIYPADLPTEKRWRRSISLHISYGIGQLSAEDSRSKHRSPADSFISNVVGTHRFLTGAARQRRKASRSDFYR